MRNTGMRLVGALGVLLGVSVPAAAAGQWVPRPAFEAFYTRAGYAGAPVAAGRVRAGGLGGRVMWPLAAGDAPSGASWLARRASVGLFGAYTPSEELAFAAGQVGVAADVVPVGALGGRVAPFVSIGAGALHTSTQARGLVPHPTVRPELAAGAGAAVAGVAGAAALGPRSTTAFLLAPGVGARVQVRPGVAVQGDLRSLVTFGGGGPRQHPAFATGVRLAF
jgi:hypothetical protein